MTAPYLWPATIKRLVLTTSVLFIVVAYTMFCGGLTTLVALFM